MIEGRIGSGSEGRGGEGGESGGGGGGGEGGGLAPPVQVAESAGVLVPCG